MPRGIKKDAPKYFVYNTSCNNFTGPFNTVDIAKREARESYAEFNDDDDREVFVLQGIGLYIPPKSSAGEWTTDLGKSCAL